MPKWQRQYESDRKYLPVWEQTFQLCTVMLGLGLEGRGTDLGLGTHDRLAAGDTHCNSDV